MPPGNATFPAPQVSIVTNECHSTWITLILLLPEAETYLIFANASEDTRDVMATETDWQIELF